MSGSFWRTFTSGQTISSADFNDNFLWFTGHFIPMNGGSFTNNAYDIGSLTFSWRNLYLSQSLMIGTKSLGVTPFAYGMGVTNGSIVVINGGVRGSLSNSGAAQEIQQGTVSTPDIRANAATQAINAGAGGTTTGATITSLTLTSIGGSIFLHGHATVEIPAHVFSAPSFLSAALTIDRDGVAITGAEQKMNNVVGFHDSGLKLHLAIHCVDTPAAGAVVYNLRCSVKTTTVAFTFSNYNLVGIELRK